MCGRFLGIVQQLALVRRVLVEDVDANAQDLVGLARQQVLDRLQGVDAGLVDVDDLQRLGVGHHDVDRHVVDHRLQALALGDDRPRQQQVLHRAVGAVQGGDIELKQVRSEADDRLVRQVRRVGQQLALVRRILVEYVDALADDVVRRHAGRQLISDQPQRLDAGIVGVGDD